MAIPPVIEAKEDKKAEAEFQMAYGRVMQRWARLEQAMFYWFERLSQMPELRARAIFYSAKNFAGRADMLAACLSHAAMDARHVAFVREAIRKARQFSSFRNRVTHGEAVFDFRPSSPTFKQYVMTEGRHDVLEAADAAVTIAQMDIAAENIRELARLMIDVLQHAGPLQYPEVQYHPKRDTSPERCLEQVRALPTEACRTEPSQTRSGRRRQPDSSRQ